MFLGYSQLVSEANQSCKELSNKEVTSQRRSRSVGSVVHIAGMSRICRLNVGFGFRVKERRLLLFLPVVYDLLREVFVAVVCFMLSMGLCRVR